MKKLLVKLCAISLTETAVERNKVRLVKYKSRKVHYWEVMKDGSTARKKRRII